jgi:molybdenum cofactor biosynthesis enzyme
MMEFVGESTGKLVWGNPNTKLAEETPKGTLESIIDTAKFAVINFLSNFSIYTPWIGKGDIEPIGINFEPDDNHIQLTVSIRGSHDRADLVSLMACIVGLTTLLDMFKSADKNVYLSDIYLTGTSFYNIKPIEIYSLSGGKTLKAEAEEVFKLGQVPGKNVILTEPLILSDYDLILLGDIWLVVTDANLKTPIAKVVFPGLATIYDPAFVIRRIRK